MDLDFNKDLRLKSILDRIKSEFNPVSGYIFGSRARGSNTFQSDYDLVFVVDRSSVDARERRRLARLALWGDPTPVDIFIYTSDEFEDQKDEFSSIPNTVLTDGIKLF